MSQDNQITLRGYLTADPRFRHTTVTQTPFAEIRMGSTPRRLNRETGEWQDTQTSYYTVKCWRRLAINAVGSLHKGDRVVVRGKFYMRSWVDNQQRPRVTMEIEADTLGHDLAYGWTHYMPGARERPAAQSVDGGELARQGQEPADQADEGEDYAGDGGWESSAGDEPGMEEAPAYGPDVAAGAVGATGDAEGVNSTDGAPGVGTLAGVGANLAAVRLTTEAGELTAEPVPF